MYLYVIFINLFNSILIGLFGYYYGRQASIFSTLLTLLTSFYFILIIVNEIVINKNTIMIDLYTFFIIDNIKVDIGFLFDQLTVIMLLVIITISMLVHIFAAGYMSHDPYIIRFFTFLGFFTFFMIILVTADNLVQMFIGWEGVGLCSYLLINYWYNRIGANKAAIKAMIMNRIADVFFILAILLILWEFKTTNYIVVCSLLDFMENKSIYIAFFDFKVINILLFLLFLGAIGKSAQIVLHTWLPDAMEGPTPVSALLHAATMVTAGVFLLVRCSLLFEKSEIILFFMLIIGSSTALFASLVATFQFDIKKIIAYSTCSQLGYMFFSCALSNYNITIFHLFNHAFFKALLFIGAGSLISSLYDEQDLRKMGALVYKMPLTYLSIIIGSLAILGVPFLTGFYSKDILLEFAYVTYVTDGLYAYCLGVLTAVFTAFYSFKLVFFAFLQKVTNYNKNSKIIEDNIFIIIVLCFLSFLSIFVGYVFADIFLGIGNNFLDKSIFISFVRYNNIEIEFLSPFLKNLPLFTSIGGCFLFYIFFCKFFIKNKKIYIFLFFIKNLLYKFFYNGAFFNFFYNKIFIIFMKIFYRFNIKLIEKGFFEMFGPFGLYLFFREWSIKSRTLSPFFISLSLLLIYLFLLFITFFIMLYYNSIINIVYIIILLYYIIT